MTDFKVSGNYTSKVQSQLQWLQVTELFVEMANFSMTLASRV